MNREEVLNMLRDMFKQCKSFGQGDVEFGKPFHDLCKEFDITIEEIEGEKL